MAVYAMKYLLIAKNQSIDVNRAVLRQLRSSELGFKKGYFTIDEENCVSLKLGMESCANRYYLEFSTTAPFLKAVKALQQLDESITRSEIQKDIEIIRSYDGISEALCVKLYPLFSTFERKMRQLILLVVTKAYGTDWRNKTVEKKQMDGVKRQLKGRKLSVSETLEQFTMYDLEQYLFALRTDGIIEKLEKLDRDFIDNMSVGELKNFLNEIKPLSLWGSLFSNLGSQLEWENQIKTIRNYRNIVAHNKTIRYSDYQKARKSIRAVNVKLEKAIQQISVREFSPENAYIVLDSFALLRDNLNNFGGLNPALWQNIAGTIRSINPSIGQEFRNTIQPWMNMDFSGIHADALKPIVGSWNSSAVEGIGDIFKKHIDLEKAIQGMQFDIGN